MNHDKKIILPEWATKLENYEPRADREDFIYRSLLRIISVLSNIRMQGTRQSPAYVSATACLGFAALTIVLCAASYGMIFLLWALALELVILCLQDGNVILNVLRRSTLAALFSLLLLIPSFFLGNNVVIWLIPVKTFITVAALCLVTCFFPWHKLTVALRLFRLPEIFVFILDTTLRYIFLLGETAKNLLIALKLRSVGRNDSKSASVAGILGATFLRSKEMSEEMYQAMICRCFTGEYPRLSKTDLRPGDGVILLFALASVALFILLSVRNAT